MQQDSASFWSDIKMYEEILAQDPESYLFARLAEVYLKVNLIDDALHVARRGVERYPAYIAGQRSLAMASYAKGLRWECRQALETVAAANPRDGQVQRILAKLLAEDGNREGAIKALRTILVFNPDDLESREELQALEQHAAPAEPESPLMESADTVGLAGLEAEVLKEEEEIIDLLESDIVDEYEPEETPAPAAEAEHTDPLSTATLAELYIQQGFPDKALGIYRALSVEDPGNQSVHARIAELEAREAAAAVLPGIADSAATISGAAFEESLSFPQGIPVQGTADDVISTLEGWLENIRRIKACR